MSRSVRIGAIAGGCLVVMVLILPKLLNVNSFRPKLESELTGALGRQVKVGKLGLSLLSGSISADNISIADDPEFSKDPFVTAKAFKAGVKIGALIFSKTLHVTGIALDEPQITLLRGADGKWNFSSIGGTSQKPAEQPEKTGGGTGNALSVDKLNIDKGRLLVGTANSAGKPQVYDNVNLEVTGFSPASQFPFTLTAALPGGGDFRLKGKAGPLTAGAAGSTPVEASLTVQSLDLAVSGFVEASSGIQGLADFDGAINSDGRQARANGTLQVEKWKLAAKGAPSKRAVTVKYAVAHDLASDTTTVTQGDVAIGKAVTRLTGACQTQGQATALNLKLNGNGLPLDDLEAALPAVGVVLPSGSKLQGGSLSADLTISGTGGSLVIAGPVRLSNAKLAGFDLSSKLSAVPALSGKQAGGKDTTIQDFSTTVRLAPDGTQADAINLDILG